MKWKRRSDVRAACWHTLLFGAIVLGPCPAALAGSQWRLISVEIDGGKDTVVRDFALGADGTPWVVLSQPKLTVCYWRDGQWHTFGRASAEPSLSPDLYVSGAGHVFLSGLRPAEPAAKDPSVPLYRLENAQATHVTDYFGDAGIFRRAVFFDSKDRVWHWGDMFLAKFEDGQWQRVEACIGPDPLVVEDTDGNVYFFGTTLCAYRDGRFILNAELPPFPWERLVLRCCLWGDNKALFISRYSPGVVVVDLNTLTISDVLRSEPLPGSGGGFFVGEPQRRDGAAWTPPTLTRLTCYDLFRDRDGDVWILTSGPHGRGYVEVSATDNSVQERPATAAVARIADQVVRCTTDGTICFGASGAGVYVYRDGMLSHVDWRQGLAINEAKWVYEHPDGTVWFASPRTGIAVYDPCGVPGTVPASPFQDSWEQYSLAGRTSLEDFQGRFWCCLSSQTNSVSCWNGQAWEHFELGFRPSHDATLWVDNLHRLYVFGTEGQGRGSKRVFARLAGERIDRFADVKEMLADSVATGARQFKGGGAYGKDAPLVIDGRSIWYKAAASSVLLRYSGETWYETLMPDGRGRLIRHADDQVLISSGGALLMLDQGRFVRFVDDHTRRREFLLTESGFQPFDPEFYRAHPNESFPARTTETALYVFDNREDFLDFREDSVPPRTAKFSRNFGRLWLAEGGYWAHPDNNSCLLQRYYHGLLLTIDLALTPVAEGFGGTSADVYEDAPGDLWLRRQLALFRVKRPRLDTRIIAPQVTQCLSPALRIEFAGAADGPVHEPLRFAWRLDGGMWSKPTQQDYADLEFTEGGSHTFEVLSIGPMANLDTTPAVMMLDVTLPVPEVRIVSAAQGVVTDLDVVIAYEVVKHPEGSEVTFQWRLDEGSWRDTRETVVRLPGMVDGEHVFEVRGVGDGKYIQAPPASARFNVKVDYEKAINSAIKGLSADDYGQREAAARRLVSLGERSVPHLRTALETADEDTRWWIQAVLAEIEDR